MQDHILTVQYLRADALHAALVGALGAKIVTTAASIDPVTKRVKSVSNPDENGQTVTTYDQVLCRLDDSATPGDLATADSVAAAHDPVFLSVDKAIIAADGVETATITVLAPKPGAAPVTLV